MIGESLGGPYGNDVAPPGDGCGHARFVVGCGVATRSKGREVCGRLLLFVLFGSPLEAVLASTAFRHRISKRISTR